MTQNYRDGSLPLSLRELERRINDLSLRVHRTAHLIGSDTATFSAADIAIRTVTHNLGKTPTYADAVLRSGGSLFYNIDFSGTGTLTATTAEYRFQHSSGTPITGTLDFQWIVFGA